MFLVCRVMAGIGSMLFVCLGNICRSPAAEGVARRMLGEAGLDVRVDSCGIGSWHVGELPDARMRACGRRRGYEFVHRARQVRGSDFEEFDVIFGMDEENVRVLRGMAGDGCGGGRVRLMSDYVRGRGFVGGIPDPYYGGEGDFEYALDLIEDAACGIVELLKEGLL